MAAEFQDTQTTLQPTQQEAPIQTNALEEGAQTFGQQAAALVQQGDVQGQRAGTMFNNANASFGQALETYNKAAEINAAKDATGIIKKDGQGQLIPPTSFYPPGISGRAYAETYKSTAQALYQRSAEQEFNSFLTVQQAKYPNDTAGFNAAAEQKRQAMLSTLDPDFKPFLDVRFEQMKSQAGSQIAVNVQSEENRVASSQAEDAYNGIYQDAAKLAGLAQQASGQSAAGRSGKDTAEFINTVVANDAVMAGRLQQAEVLARRAGYGDAKIAELRKEVGFNTAMAVYKSIYRDVQMTTPDGKYDFDKEKAIRAQISQIADLWPDRRKMVEDGILQGLAFGQQQNQLAAQGKQQRDQQFAAGQQRDMAAEAERLRIMGRDPNADPFELKTRTDALQDKSLGFLTNKGLNDSVALQLAGFATQQGLIGKQVYAEAVNNRLIDTRQLGLGPTSTPQQRIDAETQTQETLSDPRMRQLMTPEQRNFAQQSLNAMQLHRLQGDQAGLIADATMGKLDPETANTATQAAVRAGTMTQATALQIMQTAVTAHTAKQAREGLAISALQKNAAGIPVTDAEYKGYTDSFPFSPPGATPQDKVMNVGNPAHVAYALARLQQSGRVDPEFKAALAAMPRVADEGTYAPYKAAYEGVVNTMGKLGFKDEALHSAVANQIGDSTEIFHRTAANKGLEEAVKENNAKPNSQTAQQGNSVPQSDNNLNTAFDKEVAHLSEAKRNESWTARNLGMGLTDDEKRANILFGERTTPRAANEGYRAPPTSYATDPSQRSATSLTIDPSVRDYITNEAGTQKSVDGKALSGLPPGDVDGYVLRRAIDRNADLFERRLIDPQHPEQGEIYGWKTFRTNRADAMKIPALTDEAEMGMKLGILAAKTGQSPASLWAQYDPNSVKFDPYRDGYGNMWWRMNAQSGGTIVNLGDVRQDDKLFSDFTSQVTRTAATEAAAWFPGDTKKQTFFGQLFGHFVTDPSYRAVYRNKVEGILATQNKTSGWEASYIDAVHTAGNLWNQVTGQVPSPKNDAEWLAAAEAGRKADSASVSQIKRYGLLHNLLITPPDESLLPPAGTMGGKNPNMTSQPSTQIVNPQVQGRPGFATGLNMQPYVPYSGPIFGGQDKIPSPEDVAIERAQLAASGPPQSVGESMAGQRRFGGKTFGASSGKPN